MAPGKRIQEIDALRGVAVLLMVFSHGLHWAYTGTAHEIISFFGVLSPGDLAAPLFFFTAGLSLYYSLTTLLKRNFSLSELQRHYSFRLAKLFFIGVTLSLNWGVLQAQAISIFILVTSILFLLEHFSFRQIRIYILAFGILALGLHFSLVPTNCNIFSGQFPIFAILAFNAVGFYFAPCLRIFKLHYRCLGLGTVLIAVALILAEAGFSLARFNAPIAFIVLGIGLSLVLLGLLNLIVKQSTSVFSYLTRVGRDALFLFVFHYLAFYLPLFFTGFMNKMGITSSLVFASIILIVITLTAKLREHSSFSIYHLVDALLLVLVQNIEYLAGKQIQGNLQHRSVEE